VPKMLRDSLLECDVSPDNIEVIPDEQQASLRALEVAAPGDLVLILGDNVKRTWKQIIYFNSEAKGEEGAPRSTVSIELPDAGEFTFDEDVEIISDERGVRIAREEGD
jgi:cyanophycin synthetase